MLLGNLGQIYQKCLIIEFRGSIEEGPLGLSSCLPFSSSRPMTAVEDLGKDSLGSGSLRIIVQSVESMTKMMAFRCTGLSLLDWCEDMFKRNKRGSTRSHKSLAEAKTHNRYKKKNTSPTGRKIM